ncbi:MAG TPA: hypothetical protein VGB53_06325 [Rubricoccaceae bacterium]|jgi:hypothetical protein
MERFPATLLSAVLLLLAAPALRAQTAPSTADEVFVQQASASPAASLVPSTRAEAVAEIYSRLWQSDRAFLDLAFRRSDGNAVLTDQTGSENDLNVDQSGARNLAVLVQEGMQNTASVQQSGDDNVFGAWVTGDLNQIDVTQRGAGNIYLLDFEGDRLNHTVVQDGDGLQLIQTGEAEVPFSVEQRGSDASVTITHNQGY